MLFKILKPSILILTIFQLCLIQFDSVDTLHFPKFKLDVQFDFKAGIDLYFKFSWNFQFERSANAVVLVLPLSRTFIPKMGNC